MFDRVELETLNMSSFYYQCLKNDVQLGRGLYWRFLTPPLSLSLSLTQISIFGEMVKLSVAPEITSCGHINILVNSYLSLYLFTIYKGGGVGFWLYGHPLYTRYRAIYSRRIRRLWCKFWGFLDEFCFKRLKPQRGRAAVFLLDTTFR